MKTKGALYSQVDVDRQDSKGEKSSQAEKRKVSEADDEEQASVSHVGDDVTDDGSSAVSSGKRLCTSNVQT